MSPSRCAWTRRSNAPSPPSQPMRGHRSSTRTPSTTKTPKRGCPPRRSPRFPSPRSPAGRRASGSRGAWWCSRIPELNPKATPGQPALFDTHRFHAFFTTVTAATLDTVAADKVHRKHARIEQVNADLKDSALDHLPSGKFAANSAWLVAAVMAYNLTRTAGILAQGTFAALKSRESPDRHDPHQAHQRLRQGCLQRPAPMPPSARCVALANRVGEPLHRHPRTTTSSIKPANPADPAQPRNTKRETPNVKHHRQRGRPYRCQKTQNQQNSATSQPQTGSVDHGLVTVWISRRFHFLKAKPDSFTY